VKKNISYTLCFPSKNLGMAAAVLFCSLRAKVGIPAAGLHPCGRPYFTTLWQLCGRRGSLYKGQRQDKWRYQLSFRRSGLSEVDQIFIGITVLVFLATAVMGYFASGSRFLSWPNLDARA